MIMIKRQKVILLGLFCFTLASCSSTRTTEPTVNISSMASRSTMNFVDATPSKMPNAIADNKISRDAAFSKGVKAYNGTDYTTAAKWFGQAADQGLAKAQFLFGVMHAKGEGVAQNNREAAEWYRKAAEQGNTQAQFGLGQMYHKGEGVTQNDREAVKWYQKAAEQGYAQAQYNLGVMYDEGRGVAENDQEAVKWYQKAADQGLAQAQSTLGGDV